MGFNVLMPKKKKKKSGTRLVWAACWFPVDGLEHDAGASLVLQSSLNNKCEGPRLDDESIHR